MTRRVVVTGLGMLSPLGVDTETSWAAAVAGRSGISPITSFDTEGYAVRFGGRVPDFDLDAYVNKKRSTPNGWFHPTRLGRKYSSG